MRKWTKQAKVTMRAVEGVGWVFEKGFFQFRDAGGGDEGVAIVSISRGK